MAAMTELEPGVPPSTAVPRRHRHDDRTAGLPARAELVEQVMRMTDDDRLVLPYLHVAPGSEALRAATGRLLAVTEQRIRLGTPLACWSGASGKLVTSWRSEVENAFQCLWEELLFLREFVESPVEDGWCCPYRELELRRIEAIRRC